MFGSKDQTLTASSIESATKIVTAFFQKINLDPNNQRLQLDQGLGWWVNRGSSVNYIFLTKVEGIETVRIASPILFLPQDNLLALYRRCLELSFYTINCAFAINKDTIVVVSERNLRGMDAQEFKDLIGQVSYTADTYDDKLAAEFGARLYTQGR